MDRSALDRWTLLGERRNDLLRLPEVERYGRENFGDPDYVSLYGMSPGQWYSRGVRIAGRTAVECTRDRLADAICRDMQALATRSAGPVPLVIDLFAGSGNTLFWMKRHLRAGAAVGFERDGTVFALADANLRLAGAGVELRHDSYETGLPALPMPADGLLALFVAPPWGRALSPDSGLNLRGTNPPVAEVLRFCTQVLGARPALFAIQVVDRIQQDSLAEVTAMFEWSALTTYDLGTPGHHHGVLLGASGWSPDA